jgi:hypothetical protein
LTEKQLITPEIRGGFLKRRQGEHGDNFLLMEMELHCRTASHALHRMQEQSPDIGAHIQDKNTHEYGELSGVLNILSKGKSGDILPQTVHHKGLNVTPVSRASPF